MGVRKESLLVLAVLLLESFIGEFYSINKKKNLQKKKYKK